jgi:uncharacterized cofD-like protein
MYLKRWVLLLSVGLVSMSLGFAYLLAHLYRAQPLPEVTALLTIQFIDRPIRGGLFIVVGLVCVMVGLLKLNQSVLAAFGPRRGSVVDAIYSYRSRQRGPKVVLIGGGTGLSVALRGLKEHTSNLTAIVTVADDGGSSGRLRRDLGVPPPGDLRNCMVALSEAEPLLEKLFQYRFREKSELEGHSFGNLFIVAMSEVAGGFEQALRESSRVLAVRGQVLPSTMENVTLCAEMVDAETVYGESKITASHEQIRRVYLLPERPRAHREAMLAIVEADLVVVGPGSLYTSVLPNLLVRGIAQALLESHALKVYVCNVATQPGETDGYEIADHVDALLRHLPRGRNPFLYVVANSRLGLPMPPSGRVQPVGPDPSIPSVSGSVIVFADVVDETNSVRHDAGKLAATLLQMVTGGQQTIRKEPLPLHFPAAPSNQIR